MAAAATQAQALDALSTAACEFDNFDFVDLLLANARSGNHDTVARALAKALKLTCADAALAVAEHGQTAHTEDLGDLCSVGAFDDALRFCLRKQFTTLQTMQLLLLFGDVHQAIVFADDSADDDIHPNRVSTSTNPLGDVLYQFTRKLHKLCTRHEVLANVKKVVQEEVMEERIDQAALAAMEGKKGKKKDEPPPKIMVKVVVDKEIQERKTVIIDPYFAAEDLSAVIAYFDETLFQHWRLFRHVAMVQREVAMQTKTVEVEDLPWELPPLAAAVTAEDFERHEEQRAVWRECSDAMTADYNAFLGELDTLRAAYDEETAAAVDADERRVREDKEGAMNAQEFEHTVAVLETALAAQVTKKGDNAALLKRLERIEAAIAKPEPVAAPAGKSTAKK